MVLRQETGNLRDAAHQALAQMDNADVLPILRATPRDRDQTRPFARRSASYCAGH